jgi:hypothetical protein
LRHGSNVLIVVVVVVEVIGEGTGAVTEAVAVADAVVRGVVAKLPTIKVPRSMSMTQLPSLPCLEFCQFMAWQQKKGHKL